MKSVSLLAILASALLLAQTGATNGEWRYYGGDAGGTKYSPLDQINAENVKNLQIAFRWKADNFGPRVDRNWQVTPLMVGGVLYFTAGTRRDIVAVDAATGETLWLYRINEGERGEKSPRANNRGLAYWTDGRGDERILAITPGYQLVGLNAKTGLPAAGFGTNGVADLWPGLERPIQPGQITSSSPPMVVGDIAVIGSAFLAGTAPVSKANAPGYVQGMDVRTGKRVWTFRTIPKVGEFGNNTWEKDSWQYTGNTGVWAPISADLELGYVYLPVEMPTGDFYGGHRPGANLFADSLVCLNAKTGERVWHYQTVHHDLWDYDLASAPLLLNVTVNGRAIKAVAQPTKQNFLFVFDRVTGQPVWPIDERPVPQSNIPSEKTSATQPVPRKPAPFDMQGTREEDLNDLTPEIRLEALKLSKEFKLGPVYTPPILAGADGKKATLALGGSQGGANWQSSAADPETGIIYIPSINQPAALGLVPPPAGRSDMDLINGRSVMPTPFGVPLFKPPYGRITAINLNTGEHTWMVPNGEAPAYMKDIPQLKGVDLSKVGNPERAPLLVTKTLLFAGDGDGLFVAQRGAGGPTFRALDKKTGKTLFEMKLPGNETGLPMTYMLNGRQYIMVAVGSTESAAELIALTLPRQ